MKPLLAILLLLGQLAPAFGHCEKDSQAYTVRQADGSKLTLSARASRIITLAPHLTELVYAAGAGNALLATVAYSDYPQAARQLPRIGDAFRVDLEQVLALQPDLVIAWDSGNPDALLDKLESLDITVWRSEIRQPEDIPQLLRVLGRITGHAGSAKAAAEGLDRRLQQLQTRYSRQHPVSYFFQIASRPLYTVNGSHLISQGLARCGGENIFSGLAALAPAVDPEAVIAARPQVLFASQAPGDSQQLAHWNRWQQIPAVANGHLLPLHADSISRATPRFLDGLEEACHYLAQVRQAAVADKEYKND